MQKLIFFLFIFYWMPITISAQNKKEEPLNVVWISCEDMGPILGAYGNSVIKTPHLDKLASEGVRYTHAYSNADVCAPSRFSIITGMYSARLGAHNMRTGNHHNFKTPEKVKHKTYIGVRDKTGRNVIEYEVVPPPHVKPFTEELRKEGYYCANNYKCDYQFNAPFTAWDEVSDKASYKDAPEGKPFFYVWNTLVTHESRIWERKDKLLTLQPEHDLIEMFWPERLQPETAEVFFEKDEKGRVEFQCNTVGASIGYQLDSEIGSSKLRLYHKPIKTTKNQSIAARAIRIGFKASRITSNENTIK